LLKDIGIFSFIGAMVYAIYFINKKSYPFINPLHPYYIILFFIVMLLSIAGDMIALKKDIKNKRYKDKKKFFLILKELLITTITYISLFFLTSHFIPDPYFNINGLIGLLIGGTIVTLGRYKKDNSDNEDEVFEDGW
jgi:glucose uptake protein GlcU